MIMIIATFASFSNPRQKEAFFSFNDSLFPNNIRSIRCQYSFIREPWFLKAEGELKALGEQSRQRRRV